MKAQASMEFLIMFSLVGFLFLVALGIYALNINEANQNNDNLAANRICMQVSSSVGAIAALGGNSSYNFNFTDTFNGKNYTIRVASAARIVKVDYSNAGVGCKLQTTNITNSSGATSFILQKNATMKINGGAITVVP